MTAALSPAGDGPDVEVRAEVFGDLAPDALLAAVMEAAPHDAPVVAAPPAQHGLSGPAKGALVAAGAALAVWALRRRR